MYNFKTSFLLYFRSFFFLFAFLNIILLFTFHDFSQLLQTTVLLLLLLQQKKLVNSIKNLKIRQKEKNRTIYFLNKQITGTNLTKNN